MLEMTGEVYGYLFFTNVSEDEKYAFVAEHLPTLLTLTKQPKEARGLWIGDVYVEYRPKVEEFHSVFVLRA